MSLILDDILGRQNLVNIAHGVEVAQIEYIRHRYGQGYKRIGRYFGGTLCFVEATRVVNKTLCETCEAIAYFWDEQQKRWRGSWCMPQPGIYRSWDRIPRRVIRRDGDKIVNPTNSCPSWPQHLRNVVLVRESARYCKMLVQCMLYRRQSHVGPCRWCLLSLHACS
jgi:hypothetical protein